MSLRIDASHVRKDYDGKTVLRDCSYTFDRHGVYVLMGRNGSGKSTFLRICALLENADGGEISYYSEGGVLPKDLSLKRKITLVLPRIGVFNTTVFKNVAYGQKIRGISHGEIESRANNALDFVGLRHKKDQHALTLSSGETQRLGMARALVIEPEILFLDEPTASVDEENTGIIESIISKMKREDRTMVVMTTHDKDQSERLADFLLVLKDGVLGEKA